MEVQRVRNARTNRMGRALLVGGRGGWMPRFERAKASRRRARRVAIAAVTDMDYADTAFWLERQPGGRLW